MAIAEVGQVPGNITYSLQGAHKDYFQINSSGVITTAAILDAEVTRLTRTLFQEFMPVLFLQIVACARSSSLSLQFEVLESIFIQLVASIMWEAVWPSGSGFMSHHACYLH